MELFPFLMKLLLRNLFRGQFVPLHYVSLLCIILYEICMPKYANGRFLVLFFSARKKNCHHHVNGFGDLPFIYRVCSRARSLKKIFSIQLATWGKKKETSTSNENLQGYLKHMHTCIVFLINVKKNQSGYIFSVNR